MRRWGLLAGALAAATAVAVASLPRPAAPPASLAPAAPDGAGEALSSFAAPERGERGRQRAASAEKVEKVLAKKMPGLEPRERLRLARAILEEARFAAIDPLLVVALIAVESGFDHGAESVRGARGLMQLRDATLAAEAERSRLDGDLDDPVTNVRAGVRYYRRLLRAFGSHDLALMAYNAGPNRILRYMREEGEIPERFQAYPRKVQAELWRLQRGGVPAGRGTRRPPLGPVATPAGEAPGLPPALTEPPAPPASLLEREGSAG